MTMKDLGMAGVSCMSRAGPRYPPSILTTDTGGDGGQRGEGGVRTLKVEKGEEHRPLLWLEKA